MASFTARLNRTTKELEEVKKEVIVINDTLKEYEEVNFHNLNENMLGYEEKQGEMADTMKNMAELIATMQNRLNKLEGKEPNEKCNIPDCEGNSGFSVKLCNECWFDKMPLPSFMTNVKGIRNGVCNVCFTRPKGGVLNLNLCDNHIYMFQTKRQL